VIDDVIGDYLFLNTSGVRNFATVNIESTDGPYKEELPAQEINSFEQYSSWFNLLDESLLTNTVNFNWTVPADATEGDAYEIIFTTIQCDLMGVSCGETVSKMIFSPAYGDVYGASASTSADGTDANSGCQLLKNSDRQELNIMFIRV
jgi:hypothetical protein